LTLPLPEGVLSYLMEVTDMYKIGEFSKLAKISTKALRYYDEMGIFKPQEINSENGYRYYSSQQLSNLYQIVALKDSGFSMAEIRDLLDDTNTKLNELDLFKKKEKELITQMQTLERKLKLLSTYMKLIESERNFQDTPVVIKELPQQLIVSCRSTLSDYSSIAEKISELESFVLREHPGNEVPNYCFTIYHDNEYRQENIDVEICHAISKKASKTLGMEYKHTEHIPHAACIIHEDSYNTIRHSYAKLIHWIVENGYEVSGALRECYIDKHTGNSSDITEIQAPVKKSES
jgi:DNA-binding transcriptional MerR regulator